MIGEQPPALAMHGQVLQAALRHPAPARQP